MWESDTLSVFSVFLICGTYTTSDVPSPGAPRVLEVETITGGGCGLRCVVWTVVS